MSIYITSIDEYTRLLTHSNCFAGYYLKKERKSVIGVVYVFIKKFSIPVIFESFITDKFFNYADLEVEFVYDGDNTDKI